MRAVVQRVARASVRPGGAIGPGLLVLVGVAGGDGEAETERLAGRVARLRIFEGEDGKFDRSLLDTGGGALVVSQFTLLADSRRQKGTRPSFSDAARPEVAEPLIETFVNALRSEGVHVETGIFGAYMEVELVISSPVARVLHLHPRSASGVVRRAHGSADDRSAGQGFTFPLRSARATE